MGHEISYRTITQGTLSAGSNLFNQQGEDCSWARCQAFAYRVPQKGQLGIRVFACDGSRAPVAVECSDLLMHSIPSDCAPTLKSNTAVAANKNNENNENRNHDPNNTNTSTTSSNNGNNGNGNGSTYNPNPTGHKIVGGDYPGWSSEMSSSLSLRSISIKQIFDNEWSSSNSSRSSSLQGLLRGFEPMRALSWNSKAVVGSSTFSVSEGGNGNTGRGRNTNTTNTANTSDGVRVCWESKLKAQGGGIGTGGVAGMGYSWLVLKSSGGVGGGEPSIVAQGTVYASTSASNAANTTSTNNADNADNEEGTSDNGGGLLEPWVWKSCTADLSGIAVCPGDVLLVCAKPSSPFEGSIAEGGNTNTTQLSGCGVAMRRCELWAPVGTSTSTSTSGGISSGSSGSNGVLRVDGSLEVAVGVFCEHNDSSLDIVM